LQLSNEIQIGSTSEISNRFRANRYMKQRDTNQAS
jgi:hypothetical protein